MFIIIQSVPEVSEELRTYRRETRGKVKLSQKQISDWLMGQDTYTLHKPARRNRVIVGGGGGVDDQ